MSDVAEPVPGELHVRAAGDHRVDPAGHLGHEHDDARAGWGAAPAQRARQVPGAAGGAALRQDAGPGRALRRVARRSALPRPAQPHAHHHT